MIFRIKRPFYLLPSALLLLAGISASFAQSFVGNSGMSFGIIEFAASHAGELQLGTNGGVVLTGSGLFLEGDANPGQTSISGDSGIVDIRCSASASLGDGGSTDLTISPIEISLNTGVPAGSGNPCNGTLGVIAMTIDLSVTPDPKILFGGTLTIPSNALNNSTTLTTTNGQSISVSAIFQ